MSKLYRNNFPPLEDVVRDFNLSGRKLVDVTACAICGCTEYEIISRRDRHGFDLQFHLCLRCGIVYLGTRLTHAGYAKFYRDDYYKLVAAYWEQCFGPIRKRKEQKKYAEVIVPFLTRHLEGRSYSIIDVGGGMGLIAATLRDALIQKGKKAECTVLDPSPEAVGQARSLGLKAVKGLAEQYDLGDAKYDLVMLCRSIDHLIDPAGTIKRIRRALKPNGVFFCDYVTFEQVLIKRGIPKALQIDHLFNFTEEPFLTMMARCGFEPLSAPFEDKIERGFLFRQMEPEELPWALGYPSWVRGRLRKFTTEEAHV